MRTVRAAEPVNIGCAIRHSYNVASRLMMSRGKAAQTLLSILV